MRASTPLIVVATTALHFLASRARNISLELYVVSYMFVNLLMYYFLPFQGRGLFTVWASLATANVVFLLTWTLLTIIRRLFLSPLAKFPGPKLAAVSGLWNANESRLGRAARTHRALHEKFNSDVVRIGPNALSINNVDAIDKLYGGKYLRGDFLDVFTAFGGRNVATMKEHGTHSAWRRILGKAFTKSEMPHYIERVRKHVDRTIESLHNKNGSPVDCCNIMDSFAFDVIQDIGFSAEAGVQEGHGDRTAIRLIPGVLEFVAFAGHLPLLQQMIPYLPPPADGKLFGSFGDKIYDEHRTIKAPTRDILTHLLLVDRETGIAIPERDIKQHILLILLVGAHSVSTTLTCILGALATRPDIQASLSHEIRAAFDENGLLPHENIGRLKLLDSVVKEGLRMFGPLQGGTPAIVPKGGMMLCTGDFLPEHTQVYVEQYVLMSQERYFSRPNEFLPERWMEQSGGESGGPTVNDRRAWIPWGYGTHSCGGRALALEELKLVVARVVTEFEISFPQGLSQQFSFDDWVNTIKNHFLTVIEPIDLEFVPRTMALSSTPLAS